MVPFLKWAGGKRQLLETITKLVPVEFDTYYEPFLGAGAVFLELVPEKCVIGDLNSELINCYAIIRDNLDGLLNELEGYKNEKDFFYEIRALDKSDGYKELSPIKKAARMIYLNKTCFNGLYRVNKSGYFNVPFGGYRNPTYLDKENAIEISKYLAKSGVKLVNCDFEETLKTCKSDDFVYLDPPYDPVSKTAAFTAYGKDGFAREEQERLKHVLDDLTDKNVKWLLSNSDTELIRSLYDKYTIISVQAKRSINSDGNKRNPVGEVLIKNY